MSNYLEDGAGATETDAVLHLLGTDPWMRFDLWSNRAWESIETAIKFAVETGNVAPADEMILDSRVISLFNAASLAKDIADMVNPLGAVAGSGNTSVPYMSDMHVAEYTLDGEDTE